MQRFSISREGTRFFQNGEVGNGFIERTSEQATRLQVRPAYVCSRAGQFWPLRPMYVATADQSRPMIH
jgi:hypothetical protein